MSSRPYQTVPTVELARMLRAANSGERLYASDLTQRAIVRDMRAELAIRVLEAHAANVLGIGVAHGAPEGMSASC